MSFFRKKELLIFLIGLILLVVFLGYSLSGKKSNSFAEQFIKDTVGVGQKIVQTPVQFVSDIFSNIKDMKNTYKENTLLKEKIADSKSLIYENQSLEEENKELRSLLEKTESIRDYNPIQATVIARSPERWIEQVTINKGEQAGVEKDMAVITAEGMIGKVTATSQYSSNVKLLTGFDQFNRISATISRKKGDDVFGLIEGYDKEKDALTFRLIEDVKPKIKKGELVFSSGLGGVFPAGLLIGEVTDVVPGQYGLTQSALIKPAADLHSLNNVIVVDRSIELSDPEEFFEEEKETVEEDEQIEVDEE